jgi:thioredoxin-dependent peroxiredoxin
MSKILTLSTAAALLMFGSPVVAALAPGAKAPDFKTPAVMAGKPFEFDLGQTLKKGPVVLYFYPAAFTKGCTLEAHAFADQIGAFQKAGASVVGISADKIEKLTRFSVQECSNKFPVAVATPAIIKAYDAKLPLLGVSNRTSYVIAPNGQVIYAHSEMDYRNHVANTLKAVQDWRAAQSVKR